MKKRNVKEEINLMIENGCSEEEIAEKFNNEGTCIMEFRTCPKWCNEDADCFDCWCKCIKIELNK